MNKYKIFGIIDETTCTCHLCHRTASIKSSYGCPIHTREIPKYNEYIIVIEISLCDSTDSKHIKYSTFNITNEEIYDLTEIILSASYMKMAITNDEWNISLLLYNKIYNERYNKHHKKKCDNNENYNITKIYNDLKFIKFW